MRSNQRGMWHPSHKLLVRVCVRSVEISLIFRTSLKKEFQVEQYSSINFSHILFSFPVNVFNQKLLYTIKDSEAERISAIATQHRDIVTLSRERQELQLVPGNKLPLLVLWKVRIGECSLHISHSVQYQTLGI